MEEVESAAEAIGGFILGFVLLALCFWAAIGWYSQEEERDKRKFYRDQNKKKSPKDYRPRLRDPNTTPDNYEDLYRGD